MVFFTPNRRHKRRRPSKARHVAMLVVFSIMLLAPIGGQVATARQADLAQATEEVEQPEIEATEEVLVEVTEEPQNELLGAIEIDLWDCTPGYDASQPDLENLFQDCQSVDGTPFTVNTSDGQSQSQNSGEFGDGHVSFTELPTGQTTVNGPVGNGMVWCNGIVQNGGPETGYQGVDVSGGSFGWNLQDDEVVFCSWLMVPQAEPADLLVHKFACPAGYDEQADAADPMTECTEAMDGVTFVLTDDDPDTADIQTDTGDSIPGTVMFGGTAAGAYTLTETLPDDVERAFLWDCTVEDGTPSDPDSLPLNTGEAWDLTMAGKDMECSWFNVLSADASTETPDGTEAADATEAATEAPDGTEEPGNELLGAVEIEYRECAADYAFLDGTNEDQLDQMFMECASVNDVEFAIDQGGPDGTSQLTGFYGESHVSFLEVPTGMRTITQTLPFANTYVVCEGIVSNGGPETGPMVMSVSNGSIQWNLIDEEIAYCSWFVAGEGTTADPLNELVGHVNINYWECPATTDYATISDDGLATECTDSSNGVVFTVTSGAYTETQATGDLNDGFVGFSEVPTGQISVKQNTPPQQLIVICQGIVSNGGPETGLSRLPITQATIQWNLLDDEIVYCDWYVIPLPEGVGSVAINKHACPAGFDAYSASVYDLAANCHETPPVIPFTVTNGSYTNTKDVSPAPDYGDWQDVPSGELTVSETVPDGYLEPVVYCKLESYPNLDDVVPTHRVTVSNGNTFVSNLVADHLLWCDVFNVVDPGYASVAINKQACPAGFDAYSATIYELAANCHEDPGTVPFTVTSGSYTETVNASGGGNYASFTEVPPGLISVTETSPDGYGWPIVYCKVEWAIDLSDVEPTTLYPVDNTGSFQKELLGGHLLWCDVFNVPDRDTTVDVTKYICPDGTTYDHDKSWYEENCTATTDEIEFALTSADGMSYAYPSGGTIHWADVPTGAIGIQEYIPIDYGHPVVYCSINGGDWESYPAESGYVANETFGFSGDESDYTFECHWYNIPAGPGEILIYKYTCPEGYDAYAWNANPQDDCTEGTNGVTFNVEGPDGYSSQSDTGDSVQYAVMFGGLEPGSYTVVETYPDNTQYAFVWDCYGQRMGELRPTPLSTGDTLYLDVSAGEEITCYWYNVPDYDSDYGWMTVIKYTCSTATFLSEVDCEVYEDGQTFDLVVWNGSDWEYADTKTTDGAGRISWVVDPGQYWLDEQDGEWCQMTSEQLSDDGNWLGVEAGEETVVKIYNCSNEPGKPGKTPTKYPNTGVPVQREDWRLSA